MTVSTRIRKSPMKEIGSLGNTRLQAGSMTMEAKSMTELNIGKMHNLQYTKVESQMRS
jgi:hypothetical protein